MTEWEAKTSGKLLAIPHNGNLSNGRMFALSTFAGDPMSKAWADARQKWEPLFEAIQMKGQSESHPSLSTTDEFAVNYELWDRGNPIQTPMIQYEYVREALKNGLKVEQDLGANPFKYGMAGGTDTHNEAAIALSIVFVAAEIVHGLQGRPGLTARAPWVVAVAFGLLHGLGFAGALAEVGLPERAIPLALLFFNVGVEVGQLVFVAGVLTVLAAVAQARIAWPRWATAIPA